MVFPSPVFMKPLNLKQNYVQVCNTEIHPLRKRNVEIMVKNYEGRTESHEQQFFVK